MKMNPPSANDWEIASSIASSFTIGVKGGSPNAKIVYSAPIALDEASSDEERNLPRRFADHTYRDYATYIKDGGKVLKHKKSESNFPARLYALLSDEKYTHMISWMPHGRAFKVHNKKLLVEEALPKYTGQSKYSSFIRQLSGWGFKRLHQIGPDFGCYYHECFLRGHPRLTILMRRIPPGQGKATPNAFEEPDFYATAELLPLHPTGEKPLFSPESDKSGDKMEEGVVVTAIEPTPLDVEVKEAKFDPLALPIPNQNNIDSIEPNHNNFDSTLDIDMSWTRVAPICMEDGLCADPSCHGSNDNGQYSEYMIPGNDAADKDAPGIPYLQSLLHNLLVYQGEHSDTDSLPQNPLIASLDEDESNDEIMFVNPEKDLCSVHADHSLQDFQQM